MDDLKLFTETEAELDSQVWFVQIFSNDIKTKFGLLKCVTMVMRQRKLARAEGI